MSPVLLKLLAALLLVIAIPQKSDGQSDEQTPDDVLQGAIDYTCAISGVNCNMTQLYQPCNLPDTVKDHASWIFNNYYQNSKKNGGSCYFNGAAMLTELDPNAQFEQWCIADEQTPDTELQRAIDWACGPGKADCSKTRRNQPCYLPNTVRDHASWIFNNYYQNNKKKGGSCYFGGAAMITELDPSHGSCKFEFIS